MRTSRSTTLLFALGLVLALAAPVGAQYIPLKVMGEGDISPGTTDTIAIITGQHAVTSTGNLAVECDDSGATPTDDFFWVDGLDLYRAGTTVVGGGSPTDFVDNFDTYTQLNDALDLVWVGDDLNGDFLALNGTGLIFDGDVALGIPGGRLHNDFNEPCVDAAGNIYFRADLSGTTTDDGVIYYLPFGGVAEPLDLGLGTSIFQEGALIVGGALDGENWDDATAFIALECSESGVLLIEGDIETSIEVLVRKQPGVPYELLLSEGDMFLDTVNSIMAPVENINQISQAKGNLNWAIDAKFDDAVLSSTTDDVVFADVGAGIEIIAQEGQDVSAATGIPGTTLGFLSQVSVNTAGKVIYLADIQDDGTNIPPYDEAIFLWDAGVTTLVITDEIPVPGSTDLLTNLELDLVINDQDRIFFQGDLGIDDSVFEAFLPLVFPVDQLSCGPGGSPDTIIATWTNPQAYDGIRIYENGVLATTLAGGATDYSTAPVAMPTLFTIEVEPFVGADDAPIVGCNGTAVVAPDFTECSTPVPPTPIDSALPPAEDVLSYATNVFIEDVTLFLDITHTFQADLDIDVTSPAGTTVVLTTDNGGGNNDILTTFADFGSPISSNLNDFLYTQPEGPGSMADFQCEQSGGDWTLVVDDDAGGDVGVLNTWCVNIYERANPIDCCPAPSDLFCANAGACGGPSAGLTWTNNGPYDVLELLRDDGVSTTTIPLATTDTSYTDNSVVDGTSYDYTLRYQCQGGTFIQDAETCSVAIDIVTVPAVADLVCAVDACLNEATLTWDTGGVAYNSLTLNRAGVFLADVTGLSGYVDSSPLAGSATYSVIADCSGQTAAANCVVDNTLEGPADFVCEIDTITCTGAVTLTWVNQASYTALDVLIDGIAPATGPAPGDSTFTTDPLSSGSHVIDLTASCGGNSALVSCTITVPVPPAGETDCILALEGLQSGGDVGEINSVAALQAALGANGISVYVAAPEAGTGFDMGLPCGDLFGFDRIWVMTGTYPDDYRISAAEGDLLDSLAAAGAGIYFEASDHWGFIHVNSLIDGRDGIEEDIGTNVVDGDDTLTQVDGQNAPLAGVDLSANADVNYPQDQTGTDFTDQLALTGTTAGAVGDPMVVSAEALFLNSEDMIPAGDPDDAIPYIVTAIAVHTDGGRMISSSWEFGGFSLDPLDPMASDAARNSLAGIYANALGATTPPLDEFVRGDINIDGGVNIADAVYVLGNLFPGGGTPSVLNCLDSADANDDGSINIADAIALLASLFGAPTTPLPAPNVMDGCGVDPTDGDALDCATFGPCP